MCLFYLLIGAMCVLAGAAMFARTRLALDHIFGTGLPFETFRAYALETIATGNWGAGTTIVAWWCGTEILSLTVIAWKVRKSLEIYLK